MSPQDSRMRSRSMSRRSAPSASALEGNLPRIRSRSAHREQERHSWVSRTAAVNLLQGSCKSVLPASAACLAAWPLMADFIWAVSQTALCARVRDVSGAVRSSELTQQWQLL